MELYRRNLTRNIVRGALEAIQLPFAWAAEAPAAALTLLRRSRGPNGETGQAAERAKFDTGRWTPELLKHLEWRRFEELCAAYFEALGFTTRIVRSHKHGGADIALCAAGAERTSILVRCKAWTAYGVGIRSARELRAAMDAAGAGEGVVVSSGRFTQETVKFAAGENIRLIGGAELLGKLAELPPKQAHAILQLATRGDFLTPTCPCCSVKMIPRQSTSEGRTFWGCPNYPRCKEVIFDTAPG